MSNDEAIKIIKESDSCFCKHGAYKHCNSKCKYRDALDVAIKALEDKGYEQGYNDGYTEAMRDVAEEVK